MINFAKNTPLYGEFDVVVAGGGTAGFAAGVAAARAGAKTLIIEDLAYLGGTSTGGMISQFLGFSAGETTANQKGIFGELLHRLVEMGASNGVETIYLNGLRDMDVGAASYESEALKYTMDEMVRESGAEVLFHTRVIGLFMEAGAIKHLVIHNTQGIQRIQAKVYIDSTFHGSVAADAGCDWEIGSEDGAIQPGTLMYKLDGVDAARYAQVTQDERSVLAKQGIEEKRMFVNTLLARSLPDGTFYSNMSRVSVNPLDPAGLSKAEMTARSQIRSISSFFIDRIPGFQKAHVVSAGGFLSLRDSRRIMGQYILTKEDVINGMEFPDAIASSSYPIDIHDTNGVSSTLIKPKTGLFHVPFRSMLTGVRNLVLAGRCISADCEAHACIRVMVTCMRIGEAAGLGAAESITRKVDVNTLDGTILRTKLGQ